MLEYNRIDLSKSIDVNMSVKALSMQHLTIIYHNGHAYRISFVFMSKNDAFNLIKNSIIIDKKGTL